MSRHNLFFSPEQETEDFRSVLQKVLGKNGMPGLCPVRVFTEYRRQSAG